MIKYLLLTWALKTRGHDFLHIATVEAGSHDTVQCDIWPEYKLFAMMKVQCNGIFQIIE